MQYKLFFQRTILVVSLAMILLTLPGLTIAAAQGTETVPSDMAQAHGPAQVAVGSVNDTLKLCLGRFPQDASAGQLM